MLNRLKKGKNRIIFMMAFCVLGLALPVKGVRIQAGAETAAENKEDTTKSLVNIEKDDLTYCIVLDPGHGGNDSGADGLNSTEKRLNLEIGKYLKEELEQYENVKVVMTRTKDVYVGLHKRMKIAKKNHADLLISLHNDSWDPGTPYDNGCSIIVAKKGKYKPEMSAQEMYLARSILNELERLGLVNRGLVRKKSSNVPRYEDGSKGDYHAIIRDGMRYSIPGILIEHAFCDSENDYPKFLKSEEQLRALAAADARGIARYLQLRRKDTGEILTPIEIKGKMQVSLMDESAYFTLPQKRFYNDMYQKMMEAGKLRHDSNLNQSMEAYQQEKEALVAQELAAREAQERLREMEKNNAASEKQVGNVIWIILGAFAVLILIREFEFGFRFSVRIRRRGDRYSEWNHNQIQYNYKD